MPIKLVEKALVAKAVVGEKVRDVAIKVHVDSGAVKHDAENVLICDAWLHAIDCFLGFLGYQHMEHVSIWICYFAGRAILRRAQILAQHAADAGHFVEEQVEELKNDVVCVAIECRDWCQSHPQDCEVSHA